MAELSNIFSIAPQGLNNSRGLDFLPDDLKGALEESERRVAVEEERALSGIALFAKTMHQDIACADEKNRGLQGEVVALRGRVEGLCILHERQEGSLKEEVEREKTENARLREEIARITREADERIKNLIEGQKVSVEAAVQSGEVKTLAALKEAETLRLQVEQSCIETGRQVALAVKERDAIAVAEAQKLQGEIASLQLKEKTKSEQLDVLLKEVVCQKESVKQIFSWYAALFDATNCAYQHTMGCKSGLITPIKKLEDIIHERVLRMGLLEAPALQDADNQKLKEFIKALAPFLDPGSWGSSLPMGVVCKRIQGEIEALIKK